LLSDKTLYRTMRRWAQQANLQLLWQVDRDYPIEAEVVFNSSLHQAVGQVMAGVALTDYPLQAVFNSSARVLRVVRHMDDQRRSPLLILLSSCFRPAAPTACLTE
jgi:hypothetical protein